MAPHGAGGRGNNLDGLDSRITEMLNTHSASFSPAQEQGMAEVYAQLKDIAHRQRLKVSKHGLNTTALANEAWLKYSDRPRDFNDRKHFFAYCAVAMRHILYNLARHNRLATMVDVDQELQRLPVYEQSEFLVDMERHLVALEAYSPRLEKVFTYRFFGEMEMAEIAEVLGVSERTALRDWKKARAMLSAALGG
nr:ECF-type sigma factor [Haliea sp. SAOS-164]